MDIKIFSLQTCFKAITQNEKQLKQVTLHKERTWNPGFQMHTETKEGIVCEVVEKIRDFCLL